MARNIEIKARCRDRAALISRAEAIAGMPVAELAQDDTFFHCSQGRLKLRVINDASAELIAYDRPDQTGPSLSSYERMDIGDVAALRRVLERSLGPWVRIVKTRWLYMAGRTRIHIDRVAELGDFVELEVVLNEHETPADGQREAERLMAELGIGAVDLCRDAYADMLAAGA